MAQHGKAQWKALADMEALHCKQQWQCDSARREPAAAMQHKCITENHVWLCVNMCNTSAL